MKKNIFVLIVMFVFLLNVKAGSITVSRVDSENKERLETTLVGARISLYKNNCWIDSKVIDENGIVVFDNLEDGKYGIKQNDVEGYEQDLNTYYSYLYGEFDTDNIHLKSYVIEGNLIINKYIGETIDKDAVFEVYHNNNLIKTLTYENGSISGFLEYGTYLIKQVGGAKYYEFIKDFTVTIEYSRDYKFDLYSDLEPELKLFFEDKENNLNIKESELLKREIDLNKREESLQKEKELLKQKEDELVKLKNDIDVQNEKIKNESILFDEREDALNKTEKEFEILKQNLNSERSNLISLENTINKEKEEIAILKETLTKKIKELEAEKIKEENDNDNEDVLVVEVPNTFKKSYNKYISIFLIVIGSLLIFYKRKKVTLK